MSESSTDAVLTSFRSTHRRLAAAFDELGEDRATLQSYDDDWSVAQVASHLGSGTEIFHRWPTAGSPEHFRSRADYEEVVRLLQATGTIDSEARIYWDVRPSARYETLEFRATDVCPTVDEAVMVAGLVAMIELDPAADVATNSDRLTEALAEIRTGAVAPAARDDSEGRFVRGDAVGFVDGEVIAWGCGTLSSPRATLNRWLNSPPHRAILLGNARRAGVGVKRTGGCGGRAYWVMDVG